MARQQFFRQSSKRAADGFEIRFDALSGNDDQVDCRLQRVLFEPEDFADEAFPAIATVRLADAFGNDQTEPRNVPVVGKTVHDQNPIRHGALSLKHAVEFGSLSQVHLFGKTKSRPWISFRPVVVGAHGFL